MRWIGAGWGAVVGLAVVRVLLRQVRELLLDMAAVIRAWRDVLSSLRDSRPPSGGGGS